MSVSRTLRLSGWEVDGNFVSGNPVYVQGSWKAIVGRRWTTFYEVIGIEQVGAMLSVRNSDEAKIRAMSCATSTVRKAVQYRVCKGKPSP